ncbi:lantibiotic dehydratase (plasmid) [Streptomyces hirsutus]|uniref:lantibiotic dehydratase n=1 Tax=Streptomyces hirsutus TaxID=35620 RepID=UPI002F9086F5|nr:lantibiotic dehydratase [Streptomyces hirsutus]
MEQLRARVASLLGDAVLMEAVTLASPSTAHTCRQPLEGLSVKKLRTLAASLTAYAARMRARATPFGLFAGVTLAHLADASRGEIAESAHHRRVVRPDAGWLGEIVQRVERSPEGLASLKYFTSPGVLRTGNVFVLPTPDARTRRISMRATPTLTAAVDAAAGGAPGSRILEVLRTRGMTKEAATSLLQALVTHGCLVSEFRPPPHDRDPLTHVLRCLRRRHLCPELMRELESFATAIESYTAAPIGGAAVALEHVHALADRITTSTGASAGQRSPLHVDTVVRADITLGQEVQAEAQEAAGVLARFATARERRHLQQHLQETVAGYAVPLPEVVCPPLPPRPTSTHPALLTAYAAALREGRTEIALDDDLLDSIAPASSDEPVLEMDLFAVVASPDTESLNRGDFELHIRRPAASSAGTALSRFADALGSAGNAALCAIHNRTDRVAADSLPEPVITADITFRPRQPAAQNVARATLTRSASICTNSPVTQEPARQDLLSPHDLLLFPGPDGPQIWSRSRGSRVLPRAATTLNSAATGPHSAHVLAAATGQNLGIAFDWGVLASAPWLPRVRRGRTVYSPQTWRPAADLLHEGARHPAWHQHFARWCQQWSVPAQVMLVDGDRQIPLRLDDPVDVSILQRHAQKGTVTLTEGISPEHCWAQSSLGSHIVEAVFPMVAAEPDEPVTREPTAVPPERPLPPPPSLPGGEWLRALVRCPAGRQRAVLRATTRALGHQWFFTRRHDGSLDIHVPVETPGAGTWDRLLSRLSGAVADVLPDRLDDVLTISTYSRDAGFGSPSPHPGLLESWAVTDTQCALAVLDTEVPEAPLLSVLDLAARLTHLSGTRFLAGVEPDRKGFAPLRRRLLPLITGTMHAGGLPRSEETDRLHDLWEARAAATQAYLQKLPAPADIARFGPLLLEQHVHRLTESDKAPALLALASAAERAALSWHRATRDAA